MRVALADHFEDLGKQAHAARLGMWTFIASELMFFAALFGLYAAYRVHYPQEFAEATKHGNLLLGTINTVVLVTSSFFVAMAIHQVRVDKPRAAALLLFISAGCGVAFLGLKSIEYAEHFHHGIRVGNYAFPEVPGDGGRIFFMLYYVMTGLHAIHVIGGIVVLTWVGVRARSGAYGPARTEHLPLELAGMYWHLVDLIWLYLWPLFYLLR